MKKTLLPLVLSLACIMTHAQQIDKKLLIGRWELYSCTTIGHTMCRDSMAQNIRSAMAIAKELGPGYAPDDSAENVNRIKTFLANYFKTYMTFDKDGHTTAQAGGGYNGGATRTPPETGKYEWAGENKITEMIGTPHSEVFVILALTASKLVIKLDGKDGEGEGPLTFTRAN